MRDPLLERLRSLPGVEPPADVAARTRRQALVAMEKQSGADRVLVAFSRFVVPAVLATCVCVYVSWAIQFASALHR
jgi:hypothetical protein